MDRRQTPQSLQTPPKDAEITLLLGWRVAGLVDKGYFEVDEIEPSGAPDRISIRARAAEMRRNLRRRSERSWHDKNQAEKRSVLVGTEENEKRLKDTYGSEAAALAAALAAARAEQGRVERGKATMELTLALGRPELMPRTPLALTGFKREIDATRWLVVKLTHSLGDGGLSTRMELEMRTTDRAH